MAIITAWLNCLIPLFHSYTYKIERLRSGEKFQGVPAGFQDELICFYTGIKIRMF